jgi:hypothetical protein
MTFDTPRGKHLAKREWAMQKMVAENQRLGLYETPPCKTDPRAPHGFERTASHSADRYVCECEFWEPPEEKNN